MKIIDNRERKMQSFRSIHSIGEVFEYENEIFMIIPYIEDENGRYNVVCLNEGELYYFDDEQVQVLNNVSLQID